MKADFIKYVLKFKQPAGTSRGILTTKETYFIKINKNKKIGIGESAIFRGLSADDVSDYQEKLSWAVKNINLSKDDLFNNLKNYSSIIFGLEQAFQSLQAENPFHLYNNDFTEGHKGIPINGLVWMGEKKFMFEQIKRKIKQGFKVIKLKIGAIDFADELYLLKYIRSQFSPEEIEIRVDANGAFAPDEAFEKIKYLSDYFIHSIEQPIKAGQFEKMFDLCRKSPIPIALDEELIGYNHLINKKDFLYKIQPQYIILKPALHGGFIGTKTWIEAAKKLKIDWWITSALESNIGLNAIAQFTYSLNVKIPQGLGTGSLFINNIDSPLFINNGSLFYKKNENWNYSKIFK